MIRLALFLLVALVPLVVNAQDLPEVFNGKDLTGWRVSQHLESWVVQEGAIHLKSDPGREGSVLWTEREYADFVLELEFKFGKGRIDSGIFLRREPEQIQVGESNSLKRDLTGSPYIAGKGYPVEAQGVADLIQMTDWNAMKIVVIGSRYDVWLNGQHVMNYTSDSAIEQGPVGLQIHPGNEMQMQYRRIRIAEFQ